MAEKIYKITSVEKAGTPFLLSLTWEDGVKAEVSVADHVHRFDTFARLRGDGWEEFSPVIDEHGWMVEWVEDEVSMTSDNLRALWMFQTGQAMHPQDFADWMERNNLSLTKTAEALGISRRMVGYYKGGDKIIPRYILLACKGFEVEAAA